MKSRKLILTIEVESTETVKTLKSVVAAALNCEGKEFTRVKQFQVNVVGTRPHSKCLKRKR